MEVFREFLQVIREIIAWLISGNFIIALIIALSLQSLVNIGIHTRIHRQSQTINIHTWSIVCYCTGRYQELIDWFMCYSFVDIEVLPGGPVDLNYKIIIFRWLSHCHLIVWIKCLEYFASLQTTLLVRQLIITEPITVLGIINILASFGY